MKIASPHAINIRSSHPPSPVYPELVYPELVVNLQEMKQAEANGDLLLAQEMIVYHGMHLGGMLGLQLGVPSRHSTPSTVAGDC